MQLIVISLLWFLNSSISFPLVKWYLWSRTTTERINRDRWRHGRKKMGGKVKRNDRLRNRFGSGDVTRRTTSFPLSFIFFCFLFLQKENSKRNGWKTRGSRTWRNLFWRAGRWPRQSWSLLWGTFPNLKPRPSRGGWRRSITPSGRGGRRPSTGRQTSGRSSGTMRYLLEDTNIFLILFFWIGKFSTIVSTSVFIRRSSSAI